MKDITHDLSNLSIDAKLEGSKQKTNAQFYSIVQDFLDAIQLSGTHPNNESTLLMHETFTPLRMAEDFSVNSKLVITILFLWMLNLVCNSLFILELIVE